MCVCARVCVYIFNLAKIVRLKRLVEINGIMGMSAGASLVAHATYVRTRTTTIGTQVS